MGKRALIVEDDDLVRDLLSTQLQGLGFEIACSPDGEKGLADIKSGRNFDVLFLDVVMPKLNGLALLKAIRDLSDFYRQVPIFIITGNSDKGVVDKAVEFGVTDFLIKPWAATDLSQKLHSSVPPQMLFSNIRSVISRLHIEDKDLFNMPGLTQYLQGGFKAFAVTLEKDRYCFVIRKGIKVSDIGTLPQEEAGKWLTVFVRRKNKWQYCWPDAAASSECIEIAADLTGT